MMGENDTRMTAENQPYEVGDRVRINIPNPDEHDARHHGKQGTVENVLWDDLDEFFDAGSSNANTNQGWLIDVRLDDGALMGTRTRDLVRLVDDDKRDGGP